MSDNPQKFGRRTFVKGTGAAVVGAAGPATLTSARRSAETNRNSADTSDDGADDVALIGHRGFAGVDPENTVQAVRNASRGGKSSNGRRGADMVEVDIMPCADGDIVVFHDKNLDGLTDEEGVVWETDCETVTSAEVLESGETVPLLTEVMDAIPPHVGVNLEFKDRGNMSWEAFAEDALAIADDYQNDILVSSFAEDAVAAVAENYPDVPVAFLFWNDIEKGLEVTDEYGCDAMNVPFNMVQGTPFFSENIGFDNIPAGGYADVDLVEEAETRGIDLNVWTVQTWYQATQLKNAGVDGLIADYPNLL